jgi:uncharacterized protein YcfL
MKKTLLGVVGLMGFVLAGCAQNPPAYREGRAERYSPPQVQITGIGAEDLQFSTVIDRPQTWRDPSNILYVVLPVRNTSEKVLHVQYQYNFLDAQGAPLPENIAWNRKTLEPGATERIKFNSTSPRAADFQLNLRYAR